MNECDHHCEVHPKVTWTNLGAVPRYEDVYEKASPAVRAIFDEMERSVDEFKDKVRQTLGGHR